MPAQIRPSRLEVTDRFPMLAFTLRATDGPRLAEVVLASDIALFTKREGRNSGTFYSSREHGVLTIPPGGSVFTVPPEVLARFIAADRLHFALATASAPAGQDWTVDLMPGPASPYVSLSSLTDRALRRVRVFPSAPRARLAPRAVIGEWAGDRGATPSAAPIAPASANTAPPPAPAPYDDGFGPLPPLKPGASAPASDAAPSQPPAQSAPPAPDRATAPASGAPTAQGLNDGGEIDPETRGIEAAPYSEDEAAPVIAAGLSLGAKEYDRVSRTVPSPAFNEGRTGTAIDRIVIHITDAPTTSSTVNTFGAAGAQAAAHYLVGQDGEIVQFVSENDTAWHAKGANRRSIGIEHVAIKAGGADYPRRDGTMQHYDALPPTQLQYEESALLVTHLCDKYGLPKNRTTIIGHNEADPQTTHGACPTGNWDWDYFMRIVETGQCQTDAPVGQSLGGSGESIEIKYRAFIPAPLVEGPNSGYDLGPIASGEDFGGDGRGFQYSGGTSRGEITATLTLNPDGSVTDLRTIDRHWGESTAYDSTYTYHVQGKPDWWHDKQAGLTPSRRATLAAADDNLRIYSGASSTQRSILAMTSQSSVVSIYLSGSLPLVSPSPAIDAEVSIYLKNGANGPEVMAVGDHDGFPGHELYVNGQRIYGYDPVAAGNGPGNLMPPTDQEISTSWIAVPSRAAAGAQALGSSDPAEAAGDEGDIGGPVHDMEPAPGVAQASALALSVAEYPNARVMISPHFTSGRASQAIDRIVIHITSSTQSPYLGSWFQDPQSRVSSHYMVDQLGDVRQFVSESDTAWHAGNSAMNRRSIGIEHVAVEQGGAVYGSRRLPYTPPTDVEYTTSAGLVAHLCRKYNLTPDRTTIIGHSEANPRTTHTSCPNGAWDWERYMALVAAAFAGQAAAGAVELGADDWSINWDEVESIPQPTDMGCWATAAAMVIGWRDNQSVSPSGLASCINLEQQMQDGLAPAEVAVFANASGLTVQPNACFTAEGFCALLEANGPIWVAEVVNAPTRFFHAVVVTGMYRSGGAYFVRITDPLDRVVGTPGSPGARTIPPTHSTGSRYIMTYEDFTSEFEAAAGIGVIQLMHSGGTFGHTINRGSASGVGYAQGLGKDAIGSPVSPPDMPPAPAEASVTRTTSEDNGRSYDLAQLAGMRRPANALAGGAGMPAMPGERVTLDDWPYIDEGGQISKAGVAIDWKFDGAAVGDIAIAPVGGSLANGWRAAVRADIEAGTGTPDRTVMLVRVTTTFSRAGVEDQIGVTEVTLSGNGQATPRHCDAPAAPPAPSEQPAPQPAPQLVPA